MHHVNFSRMPLLRIFTGCRCRKTLVMTTSTRLRFVDGMPCRKIDRQIWVSVMYSQVRVRNGWGGLASITLAKVFMP